MKKAICIGKPAGMKHQMIWSLSDREGHVLTSSSVVFGEPETYIFDCSRTGEVLDWTERDGSQKGTLDHFAVLEDLGYSVSSNITRARPSD